MPEMRKKKLSNWIDILNKRNSMKNGIKNFLYWIRYLPIAAGVNWKDEKFQMDLKRWSNILHIEGKNNSILAQLLFAYPEFRNLFLYRNQYRILYRTYVRIFYKPLETLYLQTGEIGGGLFIQHGFSTMVAAKSIGENCWINQQVTIGYKGMGDPPVIGDNVMITCGAKVLGNITVGNNVTIGANAVVVKDVEEGATMVGVPAKRIK